MLVVACVIGLSHDLLLLDEDDVVVEDDDVDDVEDDVDETTTDDGSVVDDICVAEGGCGVVEEILIFSMPRSANTIGVVGRKIWPRCGFNASNGGDVRKFTGANK